MTVIVYIILLVLLNVSEFKNLEKISNDNLFYTLSIDTLSFSLYMFMHIYNNIGISLINIISIILLLYFYIKEKCSLIKTAFLILNIILLIILLF